MTLTHTIAVAIACAAVALMIDRAAGLRPAPTPPPCVANAAAPSPGRAKAPRSLPANVKHEDTVADLPPGKGQDETFYACAACHGVALIKAQGLSRDMWDQSFQLMIDRHNMGKPDQAERDLILDYLFANFPPRRRGRGDDNPFLKP